MEAHGGCERHDGLELTDSGDNHGACDGGNELFETHLNLQKHLKRCESGVQKKPMKLMPNRKIRTHPSNSKVIPKSSSRPVKPPLAAKTGPVKVSIE
jgi:hypothetical protein